MNATKEPPLDPRSPEFVVTREQVQRIGGKALALLLKSKNEQ